MQLPNFLPPLQWFPLPVFPRQKNYAGFAICALVNHLMQALQSLDFSLQLSVGLQNFKPCALDQSTTAAQ